MSDPGTSYRSRDEVQEVRQTRDPITQLKDKMLSSELATEAEIKAIEKEVKAEIDEATKIAKADSEIGLPELSTDVYSLELEKNIRGINVDTPLKHASLKQAVNL